VSGGFWRTTGRLLVLQASWTYERLQGLGAGFAILPLLAGLRDDPERYRAAVGRSTEYFNSHPYLAGIAVGAAARAEQEGAAGTAIQRLKTALSGPLGALGDQLFWVGVVPAISGALLAGVALGGGVPAVATGFLLYVVVRVMVTAWGLRLGLSAGLRVPVALKASGLSQQVRRVGNVAGFAIGVMLPLVLAWFSGAGADRMTLAGVVGGLAGVGAGLLHRQLPSSRRLTLIGMALVLLWRWGLG
jgi:mannose/fructose/N-acetylgalactosamine-specific phosphotransferase system component IID